MPIVRYFLDPNNPPTMSEETKARLDAMTDEELTRNALEDPDNPPWTEDEFLRGHTGQRIRLLRQALDLTQPQFAERYKINLGRLRDLEQGRTTPDSAFVAYLTVIEREREAVDRALAS